MTRLTRSLLRTATSAVVLAIALFATSGLANAADRSTLAQVPSAAHLAPAEPIVIGGPPGHRTHDATDTSVHSSGSGATAVTSAGGPGGYATQYADQTKPDTSRHDYYADRSRTVTDTVTNSHNSDEYRDSHNYRSVAGY